MTTNSILEDSYMANVITEAMTAVVEHINTFTSLTPDMIAVDQALRLELGKLNKVELIDRLVRQQLKGTVKVVQAELVGAILCDPRCVVLTYEEISETILENLNTDQKFSVNNLRWYKSNLQNVKGLLILNRMPSKERDALNRQLIKEMSE
jgi:hypothetical protein